MNSRLRPELIVVVIVLVALIGLTYPRSHSLFYVIHGWSGVAIVLLAVVVIFLIVRRTTKRP
jgi:Na+/proline symporter